MIIIKDLGMTTLDGKLVKARRYFEVECPICHKHTVKRLDQLAQEYCVSCTRKLQARELRILAQQAIEHNEKQCSMCKETKPLSAFGKKTSTLSGYRSSCKDCRYSAELATNKAYRSTDKGKAVSSNCQGRRRQQCTKHSDITSDALLLLKEQQEHKCYHCKAPLDYTTPKAVHLDHLIPLSKGGLHKLSNVAWSCASCNLKKNNTLT